MLLKFRLKSETANLSRIKITIDSGSRRLESIQLIMEINLLVITSNLFDQRDHLSNYIGSLTRAEISLLCPK